MRRCALFLVLVLVLAACAEQPREEKPESAPGAVIEDKSVQLPAPAPEPAPKAEPAPRAEDHDWTASAPRVDDWAASAPPEPAPEPKAAPSFPTDISGNALVRVYYATDRKREDTGNLIPYGGRRGPLVYGQCVVSIPPSHMTGAIEKVKYAKRPDPRTEMYVASLYEMGWAELRQTLALELLHSPEKKALVFVHGFKNSFEDAALRTAQLTYDLQFDGASLFYSWPSANSVARYQQDRDTATDPAVFGHLRAFLQDVAEQSGAERIYLIAHSMGNEVLTRAFAALVPGLKPEHRGKFKEIILASPDIGADEFKNTIAPRVLNQGPNVTLYASTQDFPLELSEFWNRFPRLGNPRHGYVVLAGMDTIDASAVSTDFLEHAYFAEHASIISDMFYNLHYGVPVEFRFGLKQERLDDKTYWKLRRVLYGDTD